MYTRIALTLLLALSTSYFALGAEPEPGLLVRLYDIGEEVHWLPELLAGQLPNAVKVVPTLDLNTERKDFGELANNFLTEVVGQIKIEQAGKYTFRLISDDGAQLWLDGRLLIDNDGAHAAAPKDGDIELPPGQHVLKIWHFQAGGGGQLTLQWQLPVAAGASPADARFELIPAALLSHLADVSKEESPGKKQFIPPLRRGRPGDGTPTAAGHPSFSSDELGDVLPLAHDLALADGWLTLSSNEQGTETTTPLAWIPDVVPGKSWGRDVYWQLHILASTGNASYERQVLVGTPTEVKRVRGDGPEQAVVFRFGQGPQPPLKSTERVAFEILAVRAVKNGLEIELTKPLDARCGWDPESYYIEQWPFDVAKGIPPHRDGIVYPVKSASVLPDRKRIFLQIVNLKPSHVVYIRLLPPCLAEDGELPWSTEAWYTLNAVPQDRIARLLPRPAMEPQNLLTEEEKQAGWRLLFNGQTTKGWHTYKKQETPTPAVPLDGGGSQALPGWQIIDGCLVRVGPGGDIVTDDEFGDFELAFEWRISPGGNSGIMYRVTEDRDYPWRTGPEYQILDNAEHADGKNPLTSAASCYALYAPLKDVTEPVGLFNKSRLIIRGQHVEHWLNGVKVVEYELGSPEWKQLVKESKFGQMPDYGQRPKGKLCLQDHGDKVWYRNIKVRAAN